MQKIVQLNRAILYCCMVVMFCLQQKVYAAPAQGKPVSLTIKNSSLAEVLRQVSKKSGLYIYFQDADLAGHRNVSLDARNKPVESVLHELLDERGFSWVEVSENTIAVKKKLEKEEKVEMDTVSTITVTGKVVDEKGEPVIGATVFVKGSGIGTTTDADGDFTLKDVRTNSGIIVSNISFLTQEVAVRGRTILGNIRLKQYVGILDEVQIQAYGTTSRRIGTGNISTVKADDIAKSPVGNPLLAIAGRVPGVFIEQSNGIPGSGVKVRIQGQNSILYGNDPFYVVDGIPYSSQMMPGLTNELGNSGDPGIGSYGAAGGNPLNFINPQDIESIDILKDADATSIYGSRAANGAIIITTKKGNSQRTAINISYEQGWAKVSRRLKLLNTSQYLEMRKEAYTNDNREIPTDPSLFTTANADLTYWDQTRNTDWQKVLIGNAAPYTNILASISGGNNNTHFLFSTGYQRDGSVTPLDLRNQKYSFHFDLNNISNNKKFKFGLSTSYLTDNNRLSAVSSLVSNAYILAPNAPNLYNSDGSLNWEFFSNGTPSWANPMNVTYGRYINKTNNILASGNIGYQLIPGLEIKSSFGYNKLETDEVNATPIGHLPQILRQNSRRSAEFNTAEISSWVIEPQLTYNSHIGPGILDVIIGGTIQQEDRDRQKLNAFGFTSDQALYNIKSASEVNVDPSSTAVILSRYKYNAVFARVNYNVKDKYIVSATSRRDGSSRFGKENRFHNFASAAVAWVFSGENFMKRKLSFLSFGKIRASYGATGSDQIGDYTYLNLYGNTATGGTPYQGIIGLEPFADFPNPYLQWEETKKFSTTIDLGFLKDRILFNLTYYENHSSNQLQSISLPSIVGGYTLKTNLPANVQNNGFEMGFNTTNISLPNFKWTSSINLTIPKNRLKSYSGLDADVKREFVELPIGSFKVYHFMGVDPSTGLYQVSDANGKATSTPNPDVDKVVYIDLNPKYYGGFQNSFIYKGVSLDILFQFVKQLAENNRFGEKTPGYIMSNQPISVLNRWRKEGDMSNIQRFGRLPTLFNTWDIADASDQAYSDASYIRLKNISLSYNMPARWISKLRIQSIRCFLQGQNIFTVTNYLGVDPETKSLRGMPPLKTFTLGVQAGL